MAEEKAVEEGEAYCLFAAPSDLLLTGTKDESTVMVMRGVAAQLAFCTLPPHSYMALGLSAL